MQELDNIVGTYKPECKVAPGFYWHRDNWHINVVSGKVGGNIPGDRSDYVKIPAPVMLAAAPVMGAAFVVFLPVVGIYLVGQYAVKKMAAGVVEGTSELAAAVGPKWHAGEAYFLGHPSKKGEKKSDSLEKKVKN